MSMNLISTNRSAPPSSKDNWAAITAISAADAASPGPNEGYVAVSAEVVAKVAALLDGVCLVNGETVTTYDFSRDDEDGCFTDAHVNDFGPAMLPQSKLEGVRDALKDFPSAVAMLDAIVGLGLQVSLSTDLAGRASPHLKGVNWEGDEVAIKLSSGNMVTMLRDLGLTVPTFEPDEVEFETFARAVNDNHEDTDYPSDRLKAFVACGRRQGATHVYWA